MGAAHARIARSHDLGRGPRAHVLDRSGPQPLLQVCTALLAAEVNIVQAYPLIIRPHGRPAVAIMVDNTDMAIDTLASKGFTMISEGDLSDVE